MLGDQIPMVRCPFTVFLSKCRQDNVFCTMGHREAFGRGLSWRVGTSGYCKVHSLHSVLYKVVSLRCLKR